MSQPLADKPVPPRQEPVDPAVIHLALRRMRNAAHGNGIDPDTIFLNGFEGGMVDYPARSLLVLKPTVFEKILPGREKGEVCLSAIDLKGKIKEATEKITIDTGIIDFATGVLEKRDDKGFMQDGIGLKFERLNRTFLYYTSCTGCSAGKINCMACQGAGLINCPRCLGHRKTSCPACHGTRFTLGRDGSNMVCGRCAGRGDIACVSCSATGKIRCRPCAGTGKTPCPKCNATGILSEMAYVTFEAQTKFEYARELLPENLVRVIDQMGPDIALRKHADVRILKEKEQKAAQKSYEVEESVPIRDEVVIPFRVRLPWGKIAFIVESNPLGGWLFGNHPRLLGLPPFLERAIGPGLDRLTQAAHSLGHVGNNIDEAIRYRIIADAMVAASTMPKRKAALFMRKRWSLGISGDVCDRMTLLAADAYTLISKGPRRYGLLAGLGLAALIDGLYLFTPLRADMAAKAPPLVLLAVDVLLTLGTGYLAEETSRFTARRALRSLFARLLPPKQQNRIRPKTGSMRTYAYAGAGFVFMAVALAAVSSGRPAPAWFASLHIPVLRIEALGRPAG